MINLKDNVIVSNKRSIYYNMIGKVAKIEKNVIYILFDDSNKNLKAFNISEIRKW